MRKSLKDLNNLNSLTTNEMKDIKGGGILGTSYNTFCDWYMGLTGQTAEELMATSIGQALYSLDVSLGLIIP